jgi:hypothetical protein
MHMSEGQSMRELLVINGLCLLIAVGALGVVAWALITGQLETQGIDGLFLILMCLLIAFAFAVPPMKELRKGALGELLKQRKQQAREKEQESKVSAASSEAQENG